VLTLRISPSAFAEVARAVAQLQGFQADARDRRRPHDEIKKWMVTRWLDNFSSKGDIYGSWPGNSTNWPPPGDTLLNTGGTLASFTRQNKAGVVTTDATIWNFRNEGGGARGGPYPVSHHTGYANPIPNWAAIPARILWAVNGDDEAKSAQILEDYLADRIRDLGLN
jgi:hypothetical protein